MPRPLPATVSFQQYLKKQTHRAQGYRVSVVKSTINGAEPQMYNKGTLFLNKKSRDRYNLNELFLLFFFF